MVGTEARATYEVILRISSFCCSCTCAISACSADVRSESKPAAASDAAAGLDSLLTSALQAEIAQVQLQQNEDMRKITSYVALASVPTMVAGIYGMNFDTMPELRWQFGYPIVLGSLVVVTAFLYRKFKKSGWL